MDLQILEYLEFCMYRKKLNEKTIKAYRIDLRQFCDFLGGCQNNIEKSDISRYITFLHKVYKPKTIKRKIASLNALFSYLNFEEIIDSNPMDKIQTKFQEPQTLPRTIPLRYIQKILRSAYNEIEIADSSYRKKVAIRDTAVLELLFATGIRVSELCGLDFKDVNLFDGNIRIDGKGSKERILQIGNSEVLAILRRYSKTFAGKVKQNGCFFINRLNRRVSDQSVRQIILKYSKKAGVTIHITPHMFRHTFATLLLEEDVDIRYIQSMLGHSSIVTTQIYTHVTSKKQKRILAVKHPRNKISLQKKE